MIDSICKPSEIGICHMGWGRRTANRAAKRGDILVIVDLLSFSSAVATAMHYGGLIYPCTESDDISTFAAEIGGEAAVGRTEVPQKGKYSLSPLTYLNIKSGTKVVVASPNGATCSRLASASPYIFAGSLLNATAVADAITKIMNDTKLSVTVIACGEREKTPEGNGPIRWAVEDYLGAGAILAKLPFKKSPDAEVCEHAFIGSSDRIDKIIWDCPSGIELRECGFGDDVRHSVCLDKYNCVPVLQDGAFNFISY